MHLKRIEIYPEKFPVKDNYPFCLEIFNVTRSIEFKTPVTFFIGENGSGKSTMLKAIAHKCKIHIWKDSVRVQNNSNRYSEDLYKYMDIEWANERVQGSFFASEIFHSFAQVLEEWAKSDPEMLKYYGGESFLTKSHGQYHMSFFKERYRIKGLYLLDEPENALSPKRQLELLGILKEMSRKGHAQFIIASHSPILLALPGADIFSFDNTPLKRIQYEETDYYQIYKNFMNNRQKYLEAL